MFVRTRTLLSFLAAATLLVAACGGSSKPASSPTTAAGTTANAPTTASGSTVTTVHVAKPAGDQPSISAQMVCQKEAITDIYNEATGVQTIKTPTPSWDKSTHIFKCVYAYAGGATMTLSVKEMSSAAETTAYFDNYASTLGKKQDLQGLGQGAFQVNNGSVVVRKDFKVLLVDITKLPKSFGVPAETPGDAAINVAEAILGCWTGA